MRGERSSRIQKELISSRDFNNADTIMSYIALATEVDTSHLNAKILEEGKRLVVPYIDVESQKIIASELRRIEDLVRGPLGIYVPKDGPDRPVPVEEIGLIVVPGIAFSKKNERLGRGKGYYDKFFSDANLFFPKTIGLAFNFQILETLPVDSHDIILSKVISD